MSLAPLLALSLALPPLQDAPPRPRLPLPRPAPTAAVAGANDNRVPAGRLAGGTLTVALDVVEAAWQPEGPGDPAVRVLALAEPGKAPQVPAPLLRAPAGTTVRLTLRNRTDSALVFRGLRPALAAPADTVALPAGATRTVTFRLEREGSFAYYATLPGLRSWRDREWLDGQLTGALVVDTAGTPPGPARDRVWMVTEYFQGYPDRPFESALVFNGKAWPHTERLTLAQGDSVRWRVINMAAIEHPMHLHGFYFRVTRRGGERADTAIAPERQALQNVSVMAQGGTMSLAFVPTTPGNWVFHCHFATHVSDEVSLRGSPDPYLLPETVAAAPDDPHPIPRATPGHAGHDMRGLVLGIKVTPAPGYREPVVAERRTIRLLAQKRPHALYGLHDAYGFVLQQRDSAPPRDEVRIPGPTLELRRGEPVRIVVRNNLDEPTGVHWHGLEIESYPDGVPNVSGMGGRIMPPIAPRDSFVAEFTPPRSGTFPYHSHLHEGRQIGSGMYGAIIVTDAPRDTTRDHLVVAGAGGPPLAAKEGGNFLLVNGRARPRALRMTAGDTNRVRIVSIHAENILRFRLADDSTVLRWRPLARDGADLPAALRDARLATTELGPGETADFAIVPTRPGRMVLEVWLWPIGHRVELPIDVVARESVSSR